MRGLTWPSSWSRRDAAVGLLVALLGCVAVATWSVRYSPDAALVNDAHSYYLAASAIASGSASPLLRSTGQGSFLDIGYPNLLALWFRIAGVSVRAGQTLNAVLWGLTALLLFLTSHRWLDRKRATIFGCLVAFSPMLTSFAPKLYSEPTAIAGGALALWSWFRVREARSGAAQLAAAVGLAAGLAVLTLTKSVFFPLLVGLTVAAWWWRRLQPAVLLTLMLVAIWPIHSEVERGGRGRLAIAGQVGRVELWPGSVALRCGVYSLSWNLGLHLFPEVEGACEPWVPTPGMPMVALNVVPWRDKRFREGFGYRDAVRLIARRPLKYALICATNLLGAVWIDGVYPAAVAGLPDSIRIPLWLFKITLSSALWVLALIEIAHCLRHPRRPSVCVPLVIPLAYVLIMQMHVLGEQRYFFPLLPLLYLLASQRFARRSGTAAAAGAVMRAVSRGWAHAGGPGVVPTLRCKHRTAVHGESKTRIFPLWVAGAQPGQLIRGAGDDHRALPWRLRLHPPHRFNCGDGPKPEPQAVVADHDPGSGENAPGRRLEIVADRARRHLGLGRVRLRAVFDSMMEAQAQAGDQQRRGRNAGDAASVGLRPGDTQPGKKRSYKERRHLGDVDVCSIVHQQCVAQDGPDRGEGQAACLTTPPASAVRRGDEDDRVPDEAQPLGGGRPSDHEQLSPPPLLEVAAQEIPQAADRMILGRDLKLGSTDVPAAHRFPPARGRRARRRAATRWRTASIRCRSLQQPARLRPTEGRARGPWTAATTATTDIAGILPS